MPSEFELLEAKKAQRAQLRREYLKNFTNPNNQGGHIFDEGVQRFLSMKVTQIEHFKETPRTAFRGIAFLAVPFGLAYWMLRTSRDAREAELRSGKVAYKDRLFKFI